MKVLIIDNGTKHLGRLKELLSGYSLVVQPLFGKYDYTLYDLIVLSGGSQFSIVSAPEIFKEEIYLIRKSDRPLIGICEGCEIIAYTFGAKLEFQGRKSKGLKRITLIGNAPFLNGLDKIEVYEAHHWAITSLGNELAGLAKSRTGYELIKHKKRKIYGMQFHPEMLKNESLGDELFRRIVNKTNGVSKLEVD